MIRTDCHMHSSFSSDSSTSMEDMVKAAIRNRLRTICFTEHMDYNFPEKYEYDFLFNPDAYFEKYTELKNKYSDYIEILSGVELGLVCGNETLCSKLVKQYPWDYVIGSVHMIYELDPYYEEYWNNKDEHLCIEKYFNTVYENLCSHDDYDSVGHLDYILRYAPNKNRTFYYKDYKTIIDKILNHIISHGKALEINSAGYKSGLNTTNPCNEIINRYKKLGGVLFTIGSDAHSVEYPGYYFNEVTTQLREQGINEYVVYKNRIPKLIHV